MAVFPEFTVVELSGFSGRSVASYSNIQFIGSALAQARLLFKLATCLSEWPDDPDSAELASYALLSLAEQVYLDQSYAEVQANPFQSETIGSYSYSKAARGKTAASIMAGLPTGNTWIDLAVERLGVCEISGGVYSSSVDVFTHDAVLREDSDGRVTLVGPKETDPLDLPFTWSVPVTYDPNRG